MLAVITAPVAAEAQQEKMYRMAATSLGCVVENAQKYLSGARGTIFINTDGCPPSRPTSILDTLTNESPDISFADEDAVDRHLALSPEELQCLALLDVPSGTEVVRYYPGACRIEAE
jgi:hypothetical protein